jgi:hypothetical protein
MSFRASSTSSSATAQPFSVEGGQKVTEAAAAASAASAVAGEADM